MSAPDLIAGAGTEPVLESFRADLTFWDIGPFHGALPGPIRLRLGLDGEIIAAAEVETGFLHRGLEKAFELRLWQSSVAYADHLDPEGAIFGEIALCLAVEEIARLEVSPRAQQVRVILSELARISAHMSHVARIARAVNAETMLHYVLRDREKVLDLFELVTGSRFSPNFLRFGGVRADVTEGFIERVVEICELIRVRLREYNDLFTFNHAFLKRTKGVGLITAEQIRRFGVTGPNARASGIPFDARKEHAYSGYDRIDFEVPTGRGGTRNYADFPDEGDAHDRFLIRLREVAQSVEILKQQCENLQAGPYSTLAIERDFAPPRGEAYVRVESSRGMLGCHVISDGGRSPARVQYRPPSVSHIALIPSLVIGEGIEDLPVILASLDFNVAEADR